MPVIQSPFHSPDHDEASGLLNEVGDMVQSVDMTGRIFYVNRAWRRALQVEGERIEGNNLFNFLAPCCIEQCRQSLQRLAAGEDVGIVSVVFRTRGGRELETEGRVTAHFEEGKPVATRGVFRITSERESALGALAQRNRELESLAQEHERRFQLADESVEYAPIGIAWLDFDGRIVRANPALHQMMGFIGEGPKPENLISLLVETELISSRQDHQLPAAEIECELRRMDGSRLPVAILRRRIGYGKTELELLIIRDLRTEREAREQIESAKRIESISLLAAGLSHDLTNALAPVLLGTELLKMRLGSEHGHLLDEIAVCATKAVGMLTQVLNLGRRAELRGRPVEVAALLKKVERMVRSSLRRDISLQLVSEPGMPAALADEVHLVRALTNLCLNSRDALPEGGTITITAGVITVDQAFNAELNPGKYVRLTVEDTGKGIPPEHLPRVFEPFFTTKGPGKGTGLGLPAVRDVARSFGGQVTLESELNRGTRVTLYLPAQLETLAIAEVEPPPGAAGPGIAGKRVLLVESDPFLRDVISEILRGEAMTVEFCDSGAEALARIVCRPSDYALLLSDLEPADVNGSALFHAVHQVAPALNLLWMTSERRDWALDRLGERHRAAIIYKPFHKNDLLASVGRALDRSPEPSIPT